MELSSCSQARVKPGSYLRPVPHSFRAGSAGALDARKPRSLNCAAGTWGAWRRAW